MRLGSVVMMIIAIYLLIIYSTKGYNFPDEVITNYHGSIIITKYSIADNFMVIYNPQDSSEVIFICSDLVFEYFAIGDTIWLTILLTTVLCGARGYYAIVN